MPFKDANQKIQRFVPRYAKTARSYRGAEAIIAAARLNNGITVTDLQDGPGKKRQFKLVYYPIQCDVEGNCNTSVCTPGRRIQPASTIFTLSECTSSEVFELAAEDIRLVDGTLDFSEHALAQIATTLPAMRKLLTMQMLDVLVADSGLQPDGNLTRRLTFSNSTNGVINPMGRWELERAFEDAGFGAPFVIGGAEVDNWKRAAATPGDKLNPGQQDAANMYYEPLLNSAFGDGNEHVIAFDPQVLKFIAWNRNAGMFATDIDSLTDLDKLFKQGADGAWYGSMLDPVYGLLWDLDIRYDGCTKTWTFKYSLEWDIFRMPEQVCNIQGVNGIMHFTTCDYVQADCPNGTALPAPATAGFKTWTPSIPYPSLISTLTVGNTTVEPKETVANISQLATLLNNWVPGYAFAVNGSTIRYSGYSGVTGQINGVALTFS